MGAINIIRLDFEGFKEAVQKGLFFPGHLLLGNVDHAKFEKFQNRQKWNPSQISDTFCELQRRMSRDYYKNVVLAQSYVLDYAALLFPAYSMLITEDLTDDWLAMVDFHKRDLRDHSLHQPLSAYIAAALLGYGESEKSMAIPAEPGNLLDYCVNAILTQVDTKYIRDVAQQHGFPEKMLMDNTIARVFWTDLFYRAVVLSALFHDMGYPWQYVSRLGAALKKNTTVLHPVDSVVKRILEQFKDRMVMLPMRHYVTEHIHEPITEGDELQELISSALETHGFPGAVAFLSLHDMIKKYPANNLVDHLQDFIVEWAAIVSMADYLEEFQRPRAMFRSKLKESRLKYYTDCSSVNVLSDADGTLTIRMTYKNKTNKAIAASFKEEETEDYFNPAEGYVDLSALGIKKVVYKQM